MITFKPGDRLMFVYHKGFFHTAKEPRRIARKATFIGEVKSTSSVPYYRVRVDGNVGSTYAHAHQLQPLTDE